MNRFDLKNIAPGDLVEYEQPISHSTARGTFQRWHATDDGQARLMVHSQQGGLDLSVDPKRVISVTRQSEEQS